MRKQHSLKRTALAVVFATAAMLGATDALPGGAGVASLVGVVAADAQTELECTNTSCTSPTTCTYRAGEKCASTGKECTVSSC